jgi:DNA primase catalytic core
MDIQDLGTSIIKKSEKYAEVMGICSTLLRSSPLAAEAREYLKPRVPTYNVAGFTFGYFPQNDDLHLIYDVIGMETMSKLGLAYDSYVYDAGYHTNRPVGVLRDHSIVLPYKNVYGDIIGIVGRSILSKEEQKAKRISKYKNTSLPKALNLFGMYNAKNDIIAKDSIVIVEGQFDCITCHRYGFKNVVALGGVAFSKFHFYLIQRYTNNILLLLDNDEAGKRERDNILSKFGKLSNIQTIELDPCYKDVDEYLTGNQDHSLLLEKLYGQVKKS